MSLFIESGYTCLNKFGEELCGDKVESVQNNDFTTLVLADGMGSGVKANILATLTSKILSTMIANNIDIEQCIETIIQTLPVCKSRGVAYSTFSVVHIDKFAKGYLYEFDNPQAIFYHEGKCQKLERQKIEVLNKQVYVSPLALESGDMIFLMSDGVFHAGIGTVLNFGWERPQIVKFLDENITQDLSARCVACMLAGACNDLYLDAPGDDTTVAVLKVREPLEVSLMVGPPIDKTDDNYYVEQFLASGQKKVVCGGTSAQIVARHLNKDLITSFDYCDKEVPPIAKIDGIDLTTEGVLTLRKLLELSEKYLSESDLTPKKSSKKDGASLLSNILFEDATKVNFFVGQSVNKAHQGLPIDITMKLKLVDKLTLNLTKMGKEVKVTYY